MCASPVCSVRFEQTGIVRMEPRLYCSSRSRQDGWIIRRASELLVGLGKDETWEILGGK